MADDYDLILAGGGLSNGLIADRVFATRPDLRVLMLERGASIGGNHTWSFHQPDVTAAQHAWLAPMKGVEWAAQEVRFRQHTRRLATGYCSIPSEKLHAHLAPKFDGSNHRRLMLNTPISEVRSDHVVLGDGTRINGACVIDGRGAVASSALALGFQKFVGLEVQTATPHGMVHPIIMDATVSQEDGYRFVYTLPMAPDRLLIEDTYYSDGAALDVSLIRARIRAYAAQQGWVIDHVVREEHGILPIVLAGDIAAYEAGFDPALPRVGLKAALFHPTTGYSLPDAAHLAEMIAAAPDLSSPAIAAMVRAHTAKLWEERGFFRFLNRMLFLAADPQKRIDVMARFYTLGEPLIRRFYAAEPTAADKTRILVGRPPVPISRALGCITTTSAWDFARRNLQNSHLESGHLESGQLQTGQLESRQLDADKR
jgi:lycopene beta-cyclase